MKKWMFFLVMMVCLLMAAPVSMAEAADAASDCAHEQRELAHISGTLYQVCSICGETVTEAGSCVSCDLDADGFCDDCGYDVRFAPWDGTLYESMEEAAAAMRPLLKKRESAYVFFEVTEEEYKDEYLHERFNDIVFAHTGAYNEGDYLAASFLMIGYNGKKVQYGEQYYCGYAPHQIPSATTAEQESALYSRIGSIIAENGWRELSGVDQVKAVYDWVCQNVDYDDAHFAECDSFYHLEDLATPIQPSYIPHCAYGAIFDGKSVCSGYAQLLYVFYNRLGVDCRMVSGTGNGGAHEWNLVELDGAYYFVDATWDSELMQSGQEYAYFLRSKANMTGHVIDDDDINGYDLAEHDYGYAPGDASEIIESGTMSGVEWRLTGDGTLTFSGEGVIEQNPVTDKSLIEKVVIGDGISAIGSIDSNRWSSGGSMAVFKNCTNLKSVELGTGLTTIGDETFLLCESLTEITIPDNVTDIGYAAFQYCENLQSVSLPENLGVLHSSLFGACYKLVDVEIPDSVTVIEGYVFDYCQSLVTVTLPAGLEKLEHRVFYECSSLETIEIPGSVKELGLQMFYNCTSLTSVTLNEGMEKLGEGVFDGCESLKEISLPSTVTSIGGYCFSSTAIRTIDLPDSMTEIPEHLFASCKYLESVVIPERVVSVGMQAFSQCTSLTRITFCGDAPEFAYDAESYGSGVFWDVTATAYYPEGNATWTDDVMQDYYGSMTWVGHIHDYEDEVIAPTCTTEGCTAYTCFCGDSYTVNVVPALGHMVSAAQNICETAVGQEVTIEFTFLCGHAADADVDWAPENPETAEFTGSAVDAEAGIVTAAFAGKSAGVTTVTVANADCSCTIIVHGDEQVVLPAMLKAIEEEAFANSPIQEVIMPDGMETIGDRAFAGCTELAIVHMPDSVVSIADNAFESCEYVNFVCTSENAAAAYAAAHGIPYTIVP